MNKDIAFTMAPQSNVANIVVFQLGSSFVETIPNPSIGNLTTMAGYLIGVDPDSPLLAEGILWLTEISLSLISTSINVPIFFTISFVSSRDVRNSSYFETFASRVLSLIIDGGT